MKYSDEQCLDVIRFCISYLYDKFSNERGLFRSTVAKPDVRLLQSQIVQNGQGKFREELDPHLVAEVLHSSLKDLRTPLLHEVYQEIMNTELVEDDFEANKAAVLKWIVELPPHKLSIVKSYFQLLSRLVTLEDNDASLTQLAYTVAPAICRPTSSAYMSIRHMEDLKRFRPVIMFLMGNSDDIFADVQTTVTLPAANTVVEDPPVEDKMLAEMMTSAMVIDVGNKSQLSTFSDEVECSSSPSPFIRPPGLLVSIPTLNFPGAVPAVSTDANTSMELDSSDDSGRRSSIPNNSYSEAEWRILHALVCGKVASFLDVDDSDVAAFVAKESSTDNYCSVMQAWTAKQVSAAINPSPMKADISNVPVSPSSSIGSMNRAVAMQKSSSRRTFRRKMVADCKALRSQIHEFEQEFALKNNRQPKPMERGVMNSAYVKYRELKRDIRDNAASDVQRVWRGVKARMAVTSMRRSLSKMSEDSGGKHRQALQFGGAEAKGLLSATASSSKSSELSAAFKRYRDLRDNKRDLKRKLKKFDEDFLSQHGRNPKKSDKEVIRPMYQKYHEIKNALEDLRVRLQQASRDSIPEDLVDEIMSPTGSHHDGGRRSFGVDSDYEGPEELERSMSKSRRDKAVESKQAAPSVAVPTDAEQAKVLDTMESLQQEKKNLHAYLKVYERDFNRTHGRPVTKNEDILPVASEYQRYKELKMLIKELKTQSP